MAFLGIGRKKQERRAQAAQATIDKILASGQQLSDQQISTAMFASDGKITTREKKILKQAVRQTERTARTEARQETKAIAYQNGIDPNKWIADGVGNLAQGVVGVASASAFGKLGGASGPAQQAGATVGRLLGVTNGGTTTENVVDGYTPNDQGNSSMIVIVIAAIIGLFLFTKKR